jgi:hypothetical protein
MQVDLHNFFKFYDEKNPKHVAAIISYALTGHLFFGVI